MGVSLQSLLLALDLRSIAQEGKGSSDSPCESLWEGALQLKSLRRRRQQKKLRIKRNNGVLRWNKRSGVLGKRRAILKGSRRPLNVMERRVKTLQNLVPNGKSIGLDGLFMETADYIFYLEMQVKVMQIMVMVLSDSNE